jgi:hypothetical protein
MQIKGNDIKVLQALQSVHTIKGYPSTLWVLIAHQRNDMAAFYDINEPLRKITVNWRAQHAVPLHKYRVFSDYAINQEEIDKATDANSENIPAPIKEYQVIVQILEMIQKQDLVESVIGEIIPNIGDVALVSIMKKVFDGYDDDKFKLHHMKQVWRWYLIIKKYSDSLPPIEEPIVPETPAIEPAPKVE